jgi:hypothetical protein
MGNGTMSMLLSFIAPLPQYIKDTYLNISPEQDDAFGVQCTIK